MKRNLKQWAAWAAHLFLYATAMSVPVCAQQAPPSADTFAFGATPKTNYGPSPLLAVTNGATSFIQFNLSGLPANATVSKATLRLYVDAITTGGSFDVYEVDTPWAERTLNFTNAPTPGLSATGSKPVSIGSSSCNQFVVVDITTLVQDWVNGTVANNGIALKLTSASGGFSFDSKESPLTSHEPELEISLATAGPAGPQGAAGATGQTGPAGPQGLPGNLNPGSPFYVQNGTTTQTGASFNIDGNGTVGGTLAGATVNSTNGYQVGGTTVFNASAALENIAIGDGAGNASGTGIDNQSLGFNAGKSLTTGAYDVLIGSGTGLATTTGSNDVAIGILSARYQTSGSLNTFVGPYTGFSTTTGSNNTFLGNGAGNLNTTGNFNTFVGDSVGYVNTTGSGNLYLGAGTGGANNTGSNNVYLSNAGVVESNAIRIGNTQTATYIAGIYGTSVAAGQPVVIDNTGHLGSTTAVNVSGTVTGNVVNSTTGYEIGGKTIFNANPTLENIVIGDGAGNAATTGNNNQFVGVSAGANVTTGSANVFFGPFAGYSTTTGLDNTAIGDHSGKSLTSATYNTFLGSWTGYSTTTGYRNTFLGNSAGIANTTGQFNTFVGESVGFANTTGSGNIYLGSGSGGANATGDNNVYISNAGASESNTIRIGNTQVATYLSGIYGSSVSSGQPVYVDSTGHLGTSGNASGYQIGGKTIFNANPAIENIAIGDGAGNSTATGGQNQIIGDQSGASLTTGNADVFMGSQAGTGTTTGNGDVFIGFHSGLNSTTGAYNTFIGGQTGSSNGTGSLNTYVGYNAGNGNNGGSGNTFIGQGTGENSTRGSNNIYINHPGVPNESNTLRIGYAVNQFSAYIAGIYGVTSASGVPVFINSNGQLGTQTSSRRYKEDISDMGSATEALMKLRPVTFYYKHEYDNGQRTLQYGLIAEEVAKVFPELVAYNPDGSPYTVRYQFLSSMLLNEAQKQYHRSELQADVIQAQQQQIDRQQGEIGKLQERLSQIEKILSSGALNSEARSTEPQRKL
jgi:hypothetical protein